MKGILLGFLLVAVCAFCHAISMFLIGEWIFKELKWIESRLNGKIYSITLSSVFAMIILLHLAEISLWAITYRFMGMLNDFPTSFEFSIGSYTTNTASGIQLPVQWRLLGQLESIAGLLLVGLSTALLFLVIRKMFELRQISQGKKR